MVVSERAAGTLPGTRKPLLNTVIELYRRAFVYRDLGQAAAVGMVGLSIALAVTVVYFRLTIRTERAKGQR